MKRFFNYLSDTRGELRHVSWPTQRQTTIYTILVILLSVVTAVYLGVLDFLFVRGLEFLVF
jgi:preprotein translocase subunit SecE